MAGRKIPRVNAKSKKNAIRTYIENVSGDTLNKRGRASGPVGKDGSDYNNHPNK